VYVTPEHYARLDVSCSRRSLMPKQHSMSLALSSATDSLYGIKAGVSAGGWAGKHDEQTHTAYARTGRPSTSKLG